MHRLPLLWGLPLHRNSGGMRQAYFSDCKYEGRSWCRKPHHATAPTIATQPNRRQSMPTADPHADTPLLTAGPRPEEAAGTIILLHGRGASAEDILGLHDEF